MIDSAPELLTRRTFLAQSAAALAVPAQPSRRPPNIVVILADDQGWGDLGCYGSPHIRTPHIDRMADEGVRFTDFYAQPMCGPSRAALLTGCYPVRNSLMFNHIPRARTGIHPREVTIAEMLKERGYATMIAGKWHLGDAPPFLPTRHGFDEWIGLPYSNDMWPYHPKVSPAEHPRHKQALERATLTGFDGQGQTYPSDWFPPLPLMSNEEVIELNPDQTQLTETYTARSIDFIRRNRQKPFFLYLAHSMPHVPLHPSARFSGRSLRGRYGDVVEELDESTGRILATIRELSLDGDTLVIYTSDNGPWAPYGMDAGSAGPLRGAKGSHWEGGIRVPMIARWPGHIAPRNVCSEPAASIDLLPTFARLASAALPGHAIDGVDIFPMMATPNKKNPRSEFYIYEGSIQYRPDQGRPTNQATLRAVRSGRWKLHFDERMRGSELYDLYSDAGESRNVHDRNLETSRRLEEAARKFDSKLRSETRPLGQVEQ